MAESLRILILEDNPADAELIQFELQEAGLVFTAKVVMSKSDFLLELQEYSPDLILSDYDLPQYNGALALAEAKRQCPDVPFILVTGAISEDRAIETLTNGAKDYVMKSRLQRLVPAVQRALAEAEEHRAREAAEKELRQSHRSLESLVEERSAALRETGELYRSLFENMLNGFAYCRMLFDHGKPQDFIYLDVNSAFESLTGLKNVVGKKVSEVIPDIQEMDADLFEIYGRVALTGKPEKFEKYLEALKMWFSVSVFSPQKEHFVAVFDVITERKLLEETQSFLLQHGYPDEDFFQSLARYLAQSLGMDYVCIDQLRGDRLTAQTVAVYFDGTFEDNVEYTLKDTPCGDVVGKTICCFPRNVRHLFPKDLILQEMGAESYIGTTLWSSKDQPIGLIAVLSRKPLVNPQLAEAILKLVAVRAAGELERKQVEEERYQSERYYRLLHETMLQGVVYQDADGKIISMNPAAVQILGKNPEEYLDHTLENGEHPTLRGDGSSFPGLEHPSMVALSTGQELRDVVMGVYNACERDYRWINVRAMPLFRSGEDKPYQVYIIFDDITESKRLEKTLQDSEVRYRRLFEAAQDGILILDAETGQIVDVNPFLMDILNYSKEEFVGKKLWEIGAFKDIEKSKIAFTELQNKQYIRYENLQLETKDGRLIDVEFVSNVYLVDHTKVIQCNIRDITERKRVETALRNSERMYRAIGESIDYGVWLCDSDGRNIYASESFLKLVGLTQEQCSSFGWGDVLHPDDAERTIAAWKECVRSGCIWDIEHRFRGVDGQWHPILARGVPVRNERGEIIFWAGINLDISKLKQTEMDLKKRTRQLEDANKELESFSYSVSHDLRAPLRAIDGYWRMILRKQGDKLDENTKSLFNVISVNVKMMGQLIDDLLAFSHMGKKALSVSGLNMEDLTRDVWEELKANNPSQFADLKISPLPPGMGDRSLIKQVLVNILSNAIKFTRGRETPLVEAGGYGTEIENVYYVRDNGVGFDMQYHDKLFGVFQRLHSATDYEGTGVGLAIVQRIILRHGGRVWAESEKDKGATFYFSLPTYIGNGL